MIILELFFELLFVILDPELQEQIQLEVEKRHIESAVLLGAPTRVEILTDFIKLGVVDFIAISHQPSAICMATTLAACLFSFWKACIKSPVPVHSFSLVRLI